MNINTLVLLGLISGLTACNTVSRGGSDYLRIDTVPQGAKVTTTIETRRSREKSKTDLRAKKEFRSCEPTPCLLQVGRRQTFAIKIEHAGYEPAEIAIHGDIPLPTTNLDMAVPVGAIAANAGIGAATGVFYGSMVVTLSQAFSYGAFQLPTSGIVAGATAAGAGIGVGMVGFDLASGSYANIYPNPVIIKLAPEGAQTITDPNMLMFKLRQAKKRETSKYCRGRAGVSEKQRKKNCEVAQEVDKERDIENAELLANEQAITDLIKDLKQQFKEEKAKARAARRNQRK